MAFQNVIFPDLKMKHGAQKEVVMPISITGNGTREVRRKQNRFERFVWSIPARTLLEADKQAVYKFLNQVNFGLDSFLYKDPTMPELNGAIMTSRSGDTWYLNLPFDSTTAGTHPIMNPVMGGFTFKKNGIAVTGVTFGGLDTNGLPHITVPTSISTDTITVTGPVYMTARFDSTFSYTITAMAPSPLGATCAPATTMVEMGDIKIVEVFER